MVCSCDAWQVGNDSVDRHCGQLFNGTMQGFVTSPNWPGDYPANVNCVWEIKPEINRMILMVAPSIELSDKQKHLCDDVLVMRESGIFHNLSGHQTWIIPSQSVDLYLTESPASRLTFETCTSMMRPVAFVARSKKLWINFHSDSRGAGPGFNIHFVTFHGRLRLTVH